LIGLVLVGCGGSADLTPVSGTQAVDQQPEYRDFIVRADGGQLDLDANRVRIELTQVNPEVLLAEGTESVSVSHFLEQMAGSVSRQGTLSYRVADVDKTITFNLEQVVVSDAGGLSVSGTLESAINAQDARAIVSETFQLARLRVTTARLGSGTLVGTLYDSNDPGNDTATIKRVGASDGFTMDLDINQEFWVDVERDDYEVTFAWNPLQGAAPVTITATAELGKTTHVYCGPLASTQQPAGDLLVHVRFDDLFNTNANRNRVTVTGGQSPLGGQYYYEGLTNDDGKITFYNIPQGQNYTIVVYDDSNNPYTQTGYIGESTGFHFTIPGHF